MMDTLRKSEKRDLLKRITYIVGKEIERWNKVEKWTDVEIARAAEVPPNRLSEYKNFDAHGRVIAEKHLLRLIEKGFVEVNTLKDELDLNKKEADYIGGLGALESESLRLKIFEAQRAGIDVEELLSKALKKRG